MPTMAHVGATGGRQLFEGHRIVAHTGAYAGDRMRPPPRLLRTCLPSLVMPLCDVGPCYRMFLSVSQNAAS